MVNSFPGDWLCFAISFSRTRMQDSRSAAFFSRPIAVNSSPPMASLIDLPATILDIAGIKKPDDYQGVSLKKVVSGEAEGPSEAFLEISENHIGRAVRTKKWTYSARACGNAAKEADAELFYDDLLYDNENDPAQKHNLVGKPGYEEVLKKMRALTEKYMKCKEKRQK